MLEKKTGPRVFVAMPFGVKLVNKAIKSPPTGDAPPFNLEIDFDEIWESLIRPALTCAGARPYRADDEVKAGDIRTDMYFELVTGEFVLADISTLNANVFYELGIRHGVSPNGVLMVDGGWDRRPFDVAPDRTFSYDGGLFEPARGRGPGWEQALGREARRLGERLRLAIENDASTTSSPVYKELGGLLPVDWTNIQNSKARYFGGQLHDWHARVRKAKRQSHVGDILTLSRDAPNRLAEWQLRLDATLALFDLGRYERAHEMLRAMVNENPECPQTRYALAKTLHRLAGKAETPEKRQVFNALVESEIEEAIRRGGDDPEALRLLGRIYKYRWRNRWEHESDPADRRRLALEHWTTAEKALFHYQEAQARNLGSFHAGINVISLLQMRVHLAPAGVRPESVDADLIGLVRTAARLSLERGQQVNVSEQDESESIWANAVLGETALLTGDRENAERYFHSAATDPDVSVSQLVSFDDQFSMYELLGFEQETVERIRHVSREQLKFQHCKRLGARQTSRRNDPETKCQVIAFRGESFEGQELERVVTEQIRSLLKEWRIGPGDLVLCGARRGSEILFATECLSCDADVRLLLPVKKSAFVDEAVRVDGYDWETRFYALSDDCEVLEQHVRLGAAPAQLDPYERNNDWCLEMARTEFGPNVRPRVIALSVGNSDLDTINERGSLSHFEHCARELDLPVERIVVSSPATEPTQFLWAFGTQLRIQQSSGDVREVPFRKSITIGRAEDNDLVLSDGSISRYHLQMEPDTKGARVSNLSRHSNMTFVDDQPLPPDTDESVLVSFQQTIRLIDGTSISIAEEAGGGGEVIDGDGQTVG